MHNDFWNNYKISNENEKKILKKIKLYENFNLNITQMNDSSFNHGTKSKSNQKYIMLHDTEMSVGASAVVNSWKNSNKND